MVVCDCVSFIIFIYFFIIIIIFFNLMRVENIVPVCTIRQVSQESNTAFLASECHLLVRCYQIRKFCITMLQSSSKSRSLSRMALTCSRFVTCVMLNLAS